MMVDSTQNLKENCKTFHDCYQAIFFAQAIAVCRGRTEVQMVMANKMYIVTYIVFKNN